MSYRNIDNFNPTLSTPRSFLNSGFASSNVAMSANDVSRIVGAPVR